MNPSIGAGICFVSPKGNKQLLFFHLPVFLSLLANLAGFIFTLTKVVRSRNMDKKSNRSRRGEEVKDNQNQKFKWKAQLAKLDEKTKKDVVRYCIIIVYIYKLLLYSPDVVHEDLFGAGNSLDL